MPESHRAVIEKKGQGEYEFTAYGEFLSYFHAHLDIFKRLLKTQGKDSATIDAILKQTKSFMTSNVKKTEQFFENLPTFASLLGVSQNQISQYLNTNFLEVLTKVQAKLKEQEIEKLKHAPQVRYRFITEEIVEGLQIHHPEGFFFAQKGILLVLENPTTGEIVEPQGLMAESAKAALSLANVLPTNAEAKTPTSLTEALATANAPPTTSTKKTSLLSQKETPILQEICELFSDSLTGEVLHPKIGPEGADNQLTGTTGPSTAPSKEEEYEIEDLDFEGDENSFAEEENQFEEVPSFSDPNFVKIQSFAAKDFFEMVQKVTQFQSNKDQVGYQNWQRSLSDWEKATLAIRNLVLREQKGEGAISHEQIGSIQEKSNLQKESVDLLIKKVKNYQWLKLALDRMLQEWRKGSPDFVSIVKLAWPHIQKAFYEAPNYPLVQTQLKALLARVKEESHRKEFSRVFTMALQFLGNKFPAE